MLDKDAAHVYKTDTERETMMEKLNPADGGDELKRSSVEELQGDLLLLQ